MRSRRCLRSDPASPRRAATDVDDLPARPDGPRAVRGDGRWPIFDPHSHIDPHRPAARNLDEVLGYHYYTELAHSAGMPADRVAAGPRPRGPGPEPRRAPRPDRQHGPVFLAAGDRPDVPRLPARPDHARDDRRPLRPGRPVAATAPAWDREVWDEDPARSRLPDQRVRRPARRLGHREVRPLPADRRPGAEAARAARRIERLRRSTGRRRAGLRHAPRRRSACCSSGSSARGRGPARSACRPTSPRTAATPEAGGRRRSAGPCTRWTSGPTSTTRSAASSSGRSPSSAPSSSCRST